MRTIGHSHKAIQVAFLMLLAASCAKVNENSLLPNAKFTEEFEKDPVAARKKFIPEDGNGPNVRVLWPVQRIEGNTIYLEDKGKIGIVLKAKAIVGKVTRKKEMAVFTIGQMKEFDGKTVIIEC